MSTFDKPAAAHDRGRAVRVAALLGVALAMTLSMAVRAEADAEDATLRIAAMQTDEAGPAVPGTARAGFELRCWQYGRLILEEHSLQLPPESASDVLRMTDAAGRPVRVLHTANATCLLKARPTPPRVLRP
jgi:hypothetical protein